MWTSSECSRFARATNLTYITFINFILDIGEFAVLTKRVLLPARKTILLLHDCNLILADHASGSSANRRVFLSELSDPFLVFFLLEQYLFIRIFADGALMQVLIIAQGFTGRHWTQIWFQHIYVWFPDGLRNIKIRYIQFLIFVGVLQHIWVM